MADPSFALVVPAEFKDHYQESMKDQGFEIAGLLNWAQAMGTPTAIHTIDDDLNSYTHIITNVSSTECEYIPVLQTLYPDKTIIGCLDYSFEILEQYGNSALIHRMITNLAKADFVFSVHPHQQEWLNAVNSDMNATHIPHPVDIDGVNTFAAKVKEPTGPPRVVLMWHQYDDKYFQGLFLLRQVERELIAEGKIESLHITIAGLKPDILALGKSPTMVPNCRSCGAQGTGLPHPPILSMGVPQIPPERLGIYLGPPREGFTPTPAGDLFLQRGLVNLTNYGHKHFSFDSFVPYTSPAEWMASLKTSALVLDLNAIHSIGRTGIESAALGIPYLGPRCVLSATELFPEICFSLDKPGELKANLKKLLSNSKYRANVGNMGKRRVKEFGFARAREKMAKMLKRARQKN